MVQKVAPLAYFGKITPILTNCVAAGCDRHGMLVADVGLRAPSVYQV